MVTRKTRSKAKSARASTATRKASTKSTAKKAQAKKASVKKTAVKKVAAKKAAPKKALARTTPTRASRRARRGLFPEPDALTVRLPRAAQVAPSVAPPLAFAIHRATLPQAALVNTDIIVPVAPRTPITTSMLATRLSPLASSSMAQLKTIATNVEASMDPRLQLAILNRRSGKRGLALASVQNDEVAVVARVTSVEAWQSLPDVFFGTTLGRGKDGFIVTGRIPVQRVEAVHAEAAVLSLKASQPVRPTLGATIKAMHIGPDALPAGTDPDGGAGVIVGIVDFGCDFAHENFRLANGKTRLLEIWHQAGIARGGSPFGYGRAYSRAEIDAALATPEPYGGLGYGPEPDSPYQEGTHGTHVMDIAAGNGRGTGQAGVAPKADLVFVEAAMTDVPWQGPETVNKSFGDSVQLLEAVRHIFDVAGERPCVCNLSLGTNGGPHDGTSLVEQGLDALVQEKPNRAIVIAASNSQEDEIHTSGRVPAQGPLDVVWQHVGADGGELELWYPGARRLRATLLAPDGTSFGPIEAGSTLPIGSDGKVAIFISSRLNDPNNNDNVIGVWLAPNLGGGTWTLRLEAADGQAVDYHAWIERDDYRQSSFAAPVPTHTLGSISTGQKTIVVASYDAHKATYPLSSFSSSGPTRDGREKPEVAAPGENVFAARSRTGTGTVRKSGTSMAAPAVTGLIALIFAEARREGANLQIDTLRTKLARSSLRNPPPGQAWDPRYGTGRADGAAVGEQTA